VLQDLKTLLVRLEHLLLQFEDVVGGTDELGV
jgi:hypothetical protein